MNMTIGMRRTFSRGGLLLGAMLSAGVASADYSTKLIGVRIHLDTTTIILEHSYSSAVNSGFTQIFSGGGSPFLQLPSKVIEGYISRYSFDPPLRISSSTLPRELGDKTVGFYFDSDLVLLEHPRPALVDTRRLNGTWIPIQHVVKVEKWAGRFDNYSRFGEPFFLPDWQVVLLKQRVPNFSCSPPTERGEIVWVSCNPKIGKIEMEGVCGEKFLDPQIFTPLLKAGNVFAIAYPAD